MEWMGRRDLTARGSPVGCITSPIVLAPRSSDLAVYKSANINQNATNTTEPSHPETNVVPLQGRPSHDEIGRSTLSGVRNEDATGASSPATTPGQWSRKKTPTCTAQW